VFNNSLQVYSGKHMLERLQCTYTTSTPQLCIVGTVSVSSDNVDYPPVLHCYGNIYHIRLVRSFIGNHSYVDLFNTVYTLFDINEG